MLHRNYAFVGLVAAGVFVATVPMKRTLTFDELGEEDSVAASVRCAPPVFDLLGIGTDDGGWFNYAPNSGIVFTPSRVQCRPAAWWRTGFGALLIAAGSALLLWSRRSTRLRHT